MSVTGKPAADDPRVVQSYWRTMEALVFDNSRLPRYQNASIIG